MTEKIKQYYNQLMNTKGLILILLVGILLLVLPNSFSKKEKNNNSYENQDIRLSDYKISLEKELSEILETIHGVSSVSVMITLVDTGETYYATTESVDEKNSNNGNANEKSTQENGTLVLKNDSGGGQSPIQLKNRLPKISGVLVTAKGVDVPAVETRVISAVRAVLDVPIHRVQVLSKQ